MSRNTDIVARYAGDEFVLILPETTEDSAQFLMDRIRENFSNIRFSLCDIVIIARSPILFLILTLFILSNKCNLI